MIVSPVIKSTYPGPGTGPFAFGWLIFAGTDLQVTQFIALTQSYVQLAWGVDFTISAGGINNRSGGSVTLTNPLAAGDNIFLRRNPGLGQDLQLRDIRNQGTQYPSTLEDAIDYLTMIAQRIDDDVTSLKTPGASAMFNDVYTAAHGDFVAGVTTTLNLTYGASGVMSNLFITYDIAGVVTPLQTDDYTLAGSVVTFVVPIPAGTTRVEIRYLQTYQVNIPTPVLTFEGTGAGAQLRNIADRLNEQVSVFDYIPVTVQAQILAGTNAADLTAYINDAIAALPAQGGAVFFPVARYLCNLIITRTNITLLGAGAVRNSVLKSQLCPFNNANPVVQVGDGTTACTGFRLNGLSIDCLSTGHYGLKIYGASNCYYRDFSVQGATIYSVWLTSSATIPTDYQFIDGYDIAGSAAGTSIALNIDYGASFTTAIFFSNGSLGGQAGCLFMLQISGCSVCFSNTWMTNGGGTGKGINSITSSGLIGKIFASNLLIDSTSGAGADVVCISDGNHVIGDVISGIFTMNGKFQSTAGTTASLQSMHVLAYQTIVEYPQIYGQLSFLYGASAPASFFPAALALMYALSTGALVVDNSATGQRVVIKSGNGQVELDNGGVSITVTCDALGNLTLYPKPGQGVQIGAASTDKIGFCGAAMITPPILATGAGHTVDDVIAKLQLLGLIIN